MGDRVTLPELGVYGIWEVGRVTLPALGYRVGWGGRHYRCWGLGGEGYLGYVSAISLYMCFNKAKRVLQKLRKRLP